MKKKATILHGTDGTPDSNWLPWARKELLDRGYDVYVPQLPESHTPNKKVYEEFLQSSGWDFTDNVLIGHSSGATTVLNLLSSNWFPRVKTVVLVGVFLNEDLLTGVSWYEKGQFDNLFPSPKLNPSLLRHKTESFYFIHGSDDPYCSFDDAKALAEAVEGEFIVVNHGLHLSSNRKELPELLITLPQQ